MQSGGLSKVFLQQHKRRLWAWYRKACILILVTGLISAGALYFCFEAGLNVWVASVPIALHLYLLVSSAFGFFDIRRIRIVPYFEKPVGGAETFWSGKMIAKHLRDLDEKASASIRDELVRLKEALALTASHGTRFCLLLREGSSVSGWEMDIRQGSFF